MRHHRSLLLVLVLASLCALPPIQAAGGRRVSEGAMASYLPRGEGGSGTPTPVGVEDVPPVARDKIDPSLLERLVETQHSAQLQGKDLRPPVTYLVYLRERASLGDLARVPRLHERRKLLVGRLQATARRSQAGVVALLQQSLREGRITRYKSYWIFNGLVVRGDLSTAIQLALRPEVEAIRPNRVHRLPSPIRGGETLAAMGEVEWNIAKIGADSVWESLGITGEGIVVANMDSGVDWTHPALQHKYRGYNPEDPEASDHNYNWFDPTGTYPDQPGPRGPVSSISDHGTHVMGIMVGSEPDGSQLIGVAPGAQWIAVKVFDDYGETHPDDAWIHDGFQWCLAPTDLNGQNPDPSKAPDIVNNSWGDPVGGDEEFRQDIDALRAAGILVIFAAGNDGPPESTVNSPGSYPNAFAVGATDANDVIASFSSRGPSPWGQLKPEVVAPGVYIRSAVAGGGYESNWSGTSMAAPHVAGLAALILQADRRNTASLTITATNHIITDTAVDLGDSGPENTYGYGRINAYQAVQAVPRYWLATSSMAAEPRQIDSGETVTFTLRIINRQSAAVEGLTLLDPLPTQLGYITGTLSGEGATYDESTRSILWDGPLPPYPDAVTISYQVVARYVPTDTLVVSTAILWEGEEAIASLSAEVLVSPADYVTFFLLVFKNAPLVQPTLPPPAGS